MPVPASIDDLSTTASSNSPAGGETPKDGDNHIRSAYSFIAILRDKLDGTSDTGVIKNGTFSGTMTGAATWSELQTFSAGIAGTTGSFSGDVTASNIVTTASGTYTPTFVGVSNVTGTPTASESQWTRVGSIVSVSGSVSVNFTAGGTATFRCTLPVTSNFAASTELNGTVDNGGDSTRGGAGCRADTSNDQALMACGSSAAGAVVVYFMFQYEVI